MNPPLDPSAVSLYPYPYEVKGQDTAGIKQSDEVREVGAADKAAVQQVSEGISPHKSCRVNCLVRTCSDAGACDRQRNRYSPVYKARCPEGYSSLYNRELPRLIV